MLMKADTPPAAAHYADEGGYSAAVEPQRADVAVGLFPGEFHVHLGMPLRNGGKQFRETAVGVGTCHQVHLAAVEQGVFQALGHAAEYAYDELGMLFSEGSEVVDAAPDALFGVVADGTGVGHYHVGIGDILGAAVAGGGEDREHDFGVGHVHLATVCLYVYLLHKRWQR